jgi:hypothetical protein
MALVSPPETSPVILECGECAHQTLAEIQTPPPWLPIDSRSETPAERKSRPEARATLSFDGGAPVSIGEPGDEGTVIPFGCVILPVLLVALAALVWLLFF